MEASKRRAGRRPNGGLWLSVGKIGKAFSRGRLLWLIGLSIAMTAVYAVIAIVLAMGTIPIRNAGFKFSIVLAGLAICATNVVYWIRQYRRCSRR
jgi:hypothetical protein